MGGFHEVEFPTNIDYGSDGGASFGTVIHTLRSGTEERVGLYESGRWRGNAAYTIRTPDDVATVAAFFRKRQGALYGFRYKDWADYTTATNGRDDPDDEDVDLGPGDDATVDFQLVKKYVDAAIGVTRTRVITKPVSGSVVVAFDGVNQASGWTVNTTTGILTFTSAPASSVASISVGFEFRVPVRFGDDIDADGLRAQLDTYGTNSIPDIPLVEDMDPTQVDDDYNYGGSTTLAYGDDVTLSLGYGRLVVLNPSAGSLKVKLPAEASLPLGWPHFHLDNISANSTLITDSSGTTLWTLAAGEGILIGLADVSGVNTWKGIQGA